MSSTIGQESADETCYICGSEPASEVGVGDICLANADPEGDTGFGW